MLVSAVLLCAGTIAAANAPPVAQDQSVITSAYTPLAIRLVATDQDNTSLTYSIVSGPSHGSLSNAGPKVIYTPAANYHGPDSFTFQAHDGQTSSNIATVTIKIPQIYQDWPYSAQEAARRQNETAVALGIPREISLNLANGVPIKFVLIPAGTFMMGTPYSTVFAHWAGESMHQVTISKPFYLGANHVTQLQWSSMEGKTVAQQSALENVISWSGRQLVGVGDDYPMYYVNWYEAANFCQKVSTHTSTAVRLPTDSQWEYAAQAGSAEMYFWRKNVPSVLSEYVWGIWNTGRITTKPEGQLQPNPFGLYDIDGNVWSWCSDWGSPTHGNAGSMPAGPVTDPTGWPSPNDKNGKVNRGGCFVSGWGGCALRMGRAGG